MEIRRPRMHMLYPHSPHPHQANNVNRLHKQEHEMSGFNTKLAVWLTRNVGTMACAYMFAVIGIAGMVGAFTGNTTLVLVFGSISSYFLQLILLPVILVGSNVLNRKQELQSNEDFEVNQKSFHDIEQIMQHLLAQDAELCKHTETLEKLMRMIAQATNREVA